MGIAYIFKNELVQGNTSFIEQYMDRRSFMSRTYNRYHTDLKLATQLDMLPEELRRRIPNSTLY